MFNRMDLPWPLPAMEGEKAEMVMRDRLWGRTAMAVSRAIVIGMVEGDLLRGRLLLNCVHGALIATSTDETKMLPLFRAAERLLPECGPAPEGFEPNEDEQEHYFGVAYTALGLLLARDGLAKATAAATALGMAVPPWEMTPEWQARTGGQH